MCRDVHEGEGHARDHEVGGHEPPLEVDEVPGAVSEIPGQLRGHHLAGEHLDMLVGTARQSINPESGHLLCGYGDNYDEFAGTSMATPHVAGVAALLAAQGRSVDNIYSTLTSTARTPVLGLRGVFSPAYGYGIVDAAAAVAAPLG